MGTVGHKKVIKKLRAHLSLSAAGAGAGWETLLFEGMLSSRKLLSSLSSGTKSSTHCILSGHMGTGGSSEENIDTNLRKVKKVN